MSPAQALTWTGATVAALAVHGVAVVAFASLVGEGQSIQHGSLRIDQANVLASQPVAEAPASSVDALTSDASVAASAPHDVAMAAQTDTDAVGESAIQTDAAIAETQTASLSETTESAALESAGPVAGYDPVVAADETGVVEAAPDLAPTKNASGNIVPASELPTVPEADSATADGATVGEAAPTAVASVEAAETVAVAPIANSSPVVSGTANADVPAPGSVQPDTDVAPVSETPALAEVPAAPDAPASQTSTSESQVAILVPETPQPPPPAPAEPPPAVTGDVLSAVRGFAGAPCFLAVPEEVKRGQWQVRTYGAAPDAFAAFEAHLRDAAGEVASQENALQQAQCAAVEFAGSLLKGDTSPLTFSVVDRRPVSGGHIRGTIAGFSKTWVYLLLVDDEGVAQDVSRYASVAGDDVVFDMPVHVKGAGRNRTQLLFALSSDQKISMLDVPSPRPLAEVIPLVRGQITASKAQVDIAVQDFSVQ